MLVVGYTSIVISMLFVYFGIRSYRDNVLGGTISFGRGFQAGMLITLISCAFYVATWLVLYYAFMPDFGDKYAAYLIDNLRASGGSQADVDAMIKQTEVYKAMVPQSVHQRGGLLHRTVSGGPTGDVDLRGGS